MFSSHENLSTKKGELQSPKSGDVKENIIRKSVKGRKSRGEEKVEEEKRRLPEKRPGGT